MLRVISLQVVQNLIKDVKEFKKGYFTNFYPDFTKIESWIKLDLLEFEKIGETVFFFKKNDNFRNLFFCTSNHNAFKPDLAALLSKYVELFTVDIVGYEKDLLEVKQEFKSKGFFEYTSLVRMSRMIGSENSTEQTSTAIYYADQEKGQEVYYLLQKYFDPFAEQLPLLQEILSWAENNKIVIFSDDAETIQGFLIFELIGLTSYLRYWFVHPEHRDKKIGSQLLKKFFSDSIGTKRQLFWVIENNENAIKRYEHFGFKKENLMDYVLINKNIKYDK